MAKKNVKYTCTTTTTLQTEGVLNIENNTIEVNGTEKDLKDLFKDFNEQCITLTIQIKDVDNLIEE